MASQHPPWHPTGALVPQGSQMHATRMDCFSSESLAVSILPTDRYAQQQSRELLMHTLHCSAMIYPKQAMIVMMFHPKFVAVLGYCIPQRRTHCILEPCAPRHVHSMPPSAQQFGPICRSSPALRIKRGSGWVKDERWQLIETL